MTQFCQKPIINEYLHSATYSAHCDGNGYPQKQFYDFYTKIAEGGPAVIIMQHAYVQLNGRFSDRQLSISDDSTIEHHKKVVQTIRNVNKDIIIVCQLAHAGIKAPNAEKYDINTMSKQDFEDVVKSFQKAAERAKSAGYDAVQIHSAHQYLLSQSISSGYNQRTDQYMYMDFKLLTDVFNAVKPIIYAGVKIQSNDFMTQIGVNYEFSLNICKTIPFDFIEISGGGRDERSAFLTGRDDKSDTFYYQDMVKLMDKQFLEDNFIIVTGGFQNIEDAKKALQLGCKMVGFSRKFIRNPMFLKNDNSICVRCNLCSKKCSEEAGLACVFKGGYGVI
ncbi:FAD/FMN dependent oxidoreductase [Spironucleus salmonicida]|uniref:FAD/FMN dependent oxidoreductase n=1 Tax=Spironucleus salmonicida TaxID=348837 RepID=V6LRZ0_9EUKA|nr:FAD/FMN dependent oxidoreductase [Spironucleus salmonicida]|eukprot:EST43549.1 FAD/FMN dependent oxidoreductase [Spironucleus salmonicida]